MKEGCYSAALIYLNGYNDMGSELNQTIILNRYARFLNYALLDNGKKEDKTTAKSYFQRSCELGFKKGCDMRNLLEAWVLILILKSIFTINLNLFI